MTNTTNRLTVTKVYEGKMGNNMRPVFDVYVDGVLVGYSSRKWLAQAIGEAIVAGHIEGTGDTTARFAKWAAKNAPAMYDRMPDLLL